MSTTIRDNPEQSRYELLVDGRLAGVAQYRLDDKRITLYHTEVEPEFGGRGLGDELARATLDDVQRRGLVLVPLCPFIAAYIRRHPDEYVELVAPGLRDRFRRPPTTTSSA